MLLTTVCRVPDHTDATIHEMIRQQTLRTIARYQNAGPEAKATGLIAYGASEGLKWPIRSP